METVQRLRWTQIKSRDGRQAWEARLRYGGACYTIYRKGRKYSLVYWSGRSAIAANFGPYATLLAAKRAARRDMNW